MRGSTKYEAWVSGILRLFFDDFCAIAIDRKLITKSLKRRIFVHSHHGEFVQFVSPKSLSGKGYKVCFLGVVRFIHKFKKSQELKDIESIVLN